MKSLWASRWFFPLARFILSCLQLCLQITFHFGSASALEYLNDLVDIAYLTLLHHLCLHMFHSLSIFRLHVPQSRLWHELAPEVPTSQGN